MDMSEKDYYALLELTEEDKKLDTEAFNEKVKKNFRKLSMKWHPDRWVNGTEEEKKIAEERFKEISEANTVLSDPQKRAQYDNGGFNPFEGGGFNPFEGFNPFGDGFNPFQGFRGRRPSGPRPERGEDITISIEITLEEAFTGCTKKVNYAKKVQCEHCKGTGSEDGKQNTCTHCNGTGMISKTTTSGNMVYTQSTVCPHCKGSGYINTNHCTECHGNGFKYTNCEDTITIPSGIANDMAVAYSGKGHCGRNGGEDGNLIVVFKVKENGTFKREGNDILYYDNVCFADALLGYDKEITTIDGKKVKLHVPELTNDNTPFIFKGKGMPTINQWGMPGKPGDFKVIVKYVLPNKLSKEQKELLKTFHSE